MSEEKQHFVALLNDFDTGMLVSHKEERLQARPMRLAKSEESGVIWFITGENTEKVDQIQQDSDVLVTLQEANSRFVSISGKASVVRDRAAIDEVWKWEFKIWFPQGKDDPDIVLIRVQADEAAYWDNTSINKVVYAFRAAKTLLTGQKPLKEKSDPDSFGHVGPRELRRSKD